MKLCVVGWERRSEHIRLERSACSMLDILLAKIRTRRPQYIVHASTSSIVQKHLDYAEQFRDHGRDSPEEQQPTVASIVELSHPLTFTNAARCCSTFCTIPDGYISFAPGRNTASTPPSLPICVGLVLFGDMWRGLRGVRTGLG